MNKDRNILAFFWGGFIQAFVICRIHWSFFLNGFFFFPFLLSFLSITLWPSLSALFFYCIGLPPCLSLSLCFMPIINSTNLFLSGRKNEMKSYSCDQDFIFLSRFLRVVNGAGPFSVIFFIAPCRKPKIVVLYVL